MRRLLIIPIIHSQSDLGSLSDAANASKSAALGIGRAEVSRRGIDQFWRELSKQLQAMQLDYKNLLVYQDGLPCIENPALQLELKIVGDLARNGSPNHQLVQWLIDQGACLVGTESTQLLMQEYAAIRRSLSQGFQDIDEQSDNTSTMETCIDDNEKECASAAARSSLLQERDRFIAERIAQTLGDKQCGILFIGMLHQVEQFLPPDITSTYPVGRPCSKAVVHR